MKGNVVKSGIVIVNTGEGKGKTTAALGAMFRAWGRGLRVCMIQFLKNERGRWGEVRAAERLEGFDLIATGDGFRWTSEDEEASREKASAGWQKAQQIITGGEYDLVVLDEFTYLLEFGWLSTETVIDWIRENKPADQHLVITGRKAPEQLQQLADVVTSMTNVKHHYEQGAKARAGIEF